MRHLFTAITGEVIVRLFLAMLAYITTLAVVAGAAFIVVMMVAGPHAGLLPHWLEVLVMLLGWLAVLLVPFLLARRVWRRLGSKPQTHLR